MVTERAWWIMNISLGLIALLLIFTLADITLPTIGQALSTFDPQEPLCIVQVGEQHSPWGDLPRCCLEAQAQLECVQELKTFPEGDTDFSCRTSPQLHYLLNNKALSYCQQQVFWRK